MDAVDVTSEFQPGTDDPAGAPEAVPPPGSEPRSLPIVQAGGPSGLDAASLAAIGPYEILPEFMDPFYTDEPSSARARFSAGPKAAGPCVRPRIRRPGR